MNQMQRQMATPPASSDHRAAFQKHAAKKSRSWLDAHRSREEGVYSDDEFRQGVWLIATVLLVMLGIGGWLILAGLV